MCYSKEVQLTTGSIILAFCLFYYTYFSSKYKTETKAWLLPFLKNIIFAFVMIGTHQVFEFLTLVTNSQIIYKTGLVISISSMYFLLRSLEIILNRDLKSKIALWFVVIVAIDAVFKKLTFNPYGAFVKHNTAWVWSFFWMLLFIYFHICAITGRKFLKDETSKKAIIIYLLATIDLCFLLSIVYTIFSTWYFSTNVCVALPSIWCTFSVAQIFVLPVFLSAVPKILDRPKEMTFQTLKETVTYFIISLVILGFFVSQLSFFKCMTLKFVFP